MKEQSGQKRRRRYRPGGLTINQNVAMAVNQIRRRVVKQKWSERPGAGVSSYAPLTCKASKQIILYLCQNH